MLLANLTDAVSSQTSFFNDWLTGLNIGGIILLLVGIALVVIEMIIPGFGIAGVSGGAAIIAGLIVSSKTFGAAMFTLAIIVILLCIAALIIFKVVFGKKHLKSKLVLEESIKGNSTELDAAAAAELVGKEGTALSMLRPSGIAMIDGKRLDVLAKGEFIQKGDAVVVTEVEGLHISVEKKNG
ncbi:MAG: hypothetical protein IJM20_07310 [Clostridia bacterium]|jgi:membrane-bound serine protease (ClpP class)|nr:hypothetical protein [Clostridia bacterium]